MNLPKISGVSYVISWQDHRNAPIPESLLCRHDINIHRFDQQGLSRNRNNAFDHCKSDIILCSDNDLTYTDEGLTAVMKAFTDHPDADFATFRSIHGGSSVIYPSESCRLSLPLPKNYYATSFELAFRRRTAGWLRCHPAFGLGAKSMHCGEDELLLLCAIHRGLNCRFFPITICSHPHLSTGTKARLSGKDLRAMGCIIALTYPISFMLRIPLKAYRVHSSRQSSLVKALWYLTSGALRAPWLFRDRRYLW